MPSYCTVTLLWVLTGSPQLAAQGHAEAKAGVFEDMGMLIGEC